MCAVRTMTAEIGVDGRVVSFRAAMAPVDRSHILFAKCETDLKAGWNGFLVVFTVVPCPCSGDCFVADILFLSIVWLPNLTSNSPACVLRW